MCPYTGISHILRNLCALLKSKFAICTLCTKFFVIKFRAISSVLVFNGILVTSGFSKATIVSVFKVVNFLMTSVSSIKRFDGSDWGDSGDPGHANSASDPFGLGAGVAFTAIGDGGEFS